MGASICDRYNKDSKQGIFLKTSGSTGIAKTIFQSPKKIISGNVIARKVQKINATSKILTVCSMQHMVFWRKLSLELRLEHTLKYCLLMHLNGLNK